MGRTRLEICGFVDNICIGRAAHDGRPEPLDVDLGLARNPHHRLFEINQAVFFDTNPIPMKYMMKRLGILEDNQHRLPMVPASPALERRLDDVLERAGLVV